MLTPLQKMGNKLTAIRKQYRIEDRRAFNYDEFANLYNETEPVDLKTNAASIGRYERAEATCPGDKWEKFLSMDKGE
jgi:hypothetical protein